MRTREAVLESLRQAGAMGASGEHLAHTLGVSRTAVAKHIAALRELGYAIEAHAGRGYRLLSAPDVAIPEEVAPLLVSPFWGRVEGAMCLASTNDAARALAREGALEGTVVVAASQSAGRGRLGRSWSSPKGGAYASVVLRPEIAPADAGPLSLVVGLGIARGLDRFDVRARLKWPNDLQVGVSKLAGVLLEMSAESDRVDWVVAGFGLNVARPAEPATGAAYLADGVADVRVAEAAAAALDGIAAAYVEWQTDGFASLVAEYESRSVLRGEEVCVRNATGAVVACGACGGVDTQGRLLVSESGGVTAVSAGEVTLRGSC